MPKPVHGEIEYKPSVIPGGGTCVHSDICPPGHDFEQITPEYREFLHKCLDEWLDKSEGTGMFYIAQEGYNF